MGDNTMHYVFCDKCKKKLLDNQGNTVYYHWLKDVFQEAIRQKWVKQGNKIYHKECKNE